MMWALIKKELLKNMFAPNFVVMFFTFSAVGLIAFILGDFFTDDPLMLVIGNLFTLLMPVMFSGYMGYLGSSAFASEFENNTFPSLMVAVRSRNKIYFSKVISSILIALVQILLQFGTLYFILSYMGTPPLYMIMQFICVLFASFLFSMVSYFIAVSMSIKFRKSSPAVLGSVIFGITSIGGISYVLTKYNPGFTALNIEPLMAFIPSTNPAYTWTSLVEFGHVVPLAIFGSVVWLILLLIISLVQFRRCNI